MENNSSIKQLIVYIFWSLSPEEAVLGRLQELGIMLGSGGSSILDSSLDSSFSSSSDPLKGAPGTPPGTLDINWSFSEIDLQKRCGSKIFGHYYHS